jgi:hypothetical protein
MSHDAAHGNAPPSAPQAPARLPTDESVANDARNTLNAAHDARAIDRRGSGGTGSTADDTAQGQIPGAAQRHSGAPGTLHAAQKSPASAFNVAPAPVQPAAAPGETEVDVFLMQVAAVATHMAVPLVSRPDNNVMQRCQQNWIHSVQDLKNNTEDEWKEIVPEMVVRRHLRK